MSQSRCVSQMRLGLTLIELVVVLAILAALTGVAVRSLEPIADQTRYEATQRQLTEVDHAFLHRQVSSESVAYTGFVTDMGRLPIARVIAGETQASELYISNPAMNPFSIEAVDDPETDEDESLRTNNVILVAAGWRGPYLPLAPGSDVIRDGYSQSLSLFNLAGNLVSDGEAIVDISSRGSNDLINLSDVGYQRDLRLPGGPFLAARFQGDVPVRVTDSDGMTIPTLNPDERLLVRVYGPGPDSSGINGEGVLLDNVEWSVTSPAGYAGVLSNLVCGPKALRALIVTGSSPSEVVARNKDSLVRQIQVQPGMNGEVVLRLP